MKTNTHQNKLQCLQWKKQGKEEDHKKDKGIWLKKKAYTGNKQQAGNGQRLGTGLRLYQKQRSATTRKNDGIWDSRSTAS
jgi:hypothetical protein